MRGDFGEMLDYDIPDQIEAEKICFGNSNHAVSTVEAWAGEMSGWENHPCSGASDRIFYFISFLNFYMTERV